MKPGPRPRSARAPKAPVYLSSGQLLRLAGAGGGGHCGYIIRAMDAGYITPAAYLGERPIYGWDESAVDGLRRYMAARDPRRATKFSQYNAQRKKTDAQ